MFKMEIKKVIRSLTFILFAVVMIGTYITQMMPELHDAVSKPEPGQDYYGSFTVESADILMPAATESLLAEYLAGYYQAYPVMFYKEVHLKEDDEKRMADILQKLTGLTKAELDQFTDYTPGGYVQSVDENGEPIVEYHEPVFPEYVFNKNISYEEFKELMEQADNIIGGGSKYASEKLISNFSNVPMTYEDALAEYEAITSENHVGESYTRLFCDYMGIFVAVISIFVAAFYWNMDHSAKVQEIVYSRKIGTVKLVLVRIGALMVSMLPVIMIPYIHMMIKVNSLYSDISIQWGMAILQMLLWMIPEILFVTVLSALITETISPYLSVFIQCAWWYTSLQMNDLVGDISKWDLIVRHNTLGDIVVWNNKWINFVWNRMIYFVLSIVITVILIAVYNLKRRGKMNFGLKSVKRSNRKKSVDSI